jgi:hypothetical protein
MQGLLSTSIVLVGLLLYGILGPGETPRKTVNVQEETTAAYDDADQARRQIQILERKALTGEAPPPFAPEELDQIREHLAVLERSESRFRRLDGLLRKHHLEECEDMKGLSTCWVRTRLWISDARAVIGLRTDPGAAPGLYIPLHRALARWQKARDELRELRSRSDAMGDPADTRERREVLARIRGLRETLADCRDEFLRLEGFVATGLGLDPLPVRDLPDVELLREHASLVQQAMVTAADLGSRFRED